MVYFAVLLLIKYYPTCDGSEIVLLIDKNAALASFVRTSSEAYPAMCAVRRAWELLDSRIYFHGLKEWPRSKT